MLPNGYWNDENGHKKLEYIMEIPCWEIKQIEGPANGSEFPPGRTKVKYKYYDLCGNINYCSFDVHIGNNFKLSCPDDIYIDCEYGKSGAYIYWDEPHLESCCHYNCEAGNPIEGFVYMGEFEGHHYYCSTEPDYWENANQACNENGGYLVSINSAEENAFLTPKIYTVRSAFIGLTDRDEEGTFVWSNGDPVVYKNWYPGQPNNKYGQQDYVELLYNGKWNDEYNNRKLEYIMEKPGCSQVVQISGPPPGSFINKGEKKKVIYKAYDNCGNVDYCSFYRIL